MSRRIWALDLATRTGWARWDAGAISSSIVQLPGTGGEGFAALRSWLTRNVVAGDEMWVEMPHHRGGFTTRGLLGLLAMAELHAYDVSCSIGRVHAATYRAGLLPKGSPRTKDVYVALAKQRWPWVRDDNEADALLLLDWRLRNPPSS